VTTAVAAEPTGAKTLSLVRAAFHRAALSIEHHLLVTERRLPVKSAQQHQDRLHDTVRQTVPDYSFDGSY
jgi:hypothetical protein